MHNLPDHERKTLRWAEFQVHLPGSPGQDHGLLKIIDYQNTILTTTISKVQPSFLQNGNSNSQML